MHNIESFCRCHFNEPVITCMGQVGRLIGFGSDECDYYYIIKEQDGTITWHSAVGHCMTLNALRDQGVVYSNTGERWDNYVRLNSMLELNGCPKEDIFIKEHRENSGLYDFEVSC